MNTARNEACDEELARSAQSGATASFEELVWRYEGRLFRFLKQSCRNEADAADLTQEAFVAAYANLARYDSERSFATWLFTIARRKLIDHFRAKRPADEASLPEMVDEDDPAVLLERRDEQQALWNVARSVLTPVQFEALWLKYVEEMSVAQIARVLGRLQPHVKVILFRARAALAAELERSAQRDTTNQAGTRSPEFRPNSPTNLSRLAIAWASDQRL